MIPTQAQIKACPHKECGRYKFHDRDEWACRAMRDNACAAAYGAETPTPTAPKAAEPFVGPFFITTPWTGAAVIDSAGRPVSSGLTSYQAAWLAARLNASIPQAAQDVRRGPIPPKEERKMSRNIIDAAIRLSNATPEEIQSIAAHDWDMIREVAAMFLADRKEALLKKAHEKPHRTCSHGAPI